MEEALYRLAMSNHTYLTLCSAGGQTQSFVNNRHSSNWAISADSHKHLICKIAPSKSNNQGESSRAETCVHFFWSKSVPVANITGWFVWTGDGRSVPHKQGRTHCTQPLTSPACLSFAVSELWDQVQLPDRTSTKTDSLNFPVLKLPSFCCLGRSARYDCHPINGLFLGGPMGNLEHWTGENKEEKYSLLCPSQLPPQQKAD